MGNLHESFLPGQKPEQTEEVYTPLYTLHNLNRSNHLWNAYANYKFNDAY